MKKVNQPTNFGLLIGGIFVSIIGIMHFFMPKYGYEKLIPNQMPHNVADHFYYLGTYAIGSFLLTLGFISIYTSRLKDRDYLFAISSSLSVLWILRFVLEIIYPVNLKLFFLNRPTVLLLPFIGCIALIYSVGTVSYLLKAKK